MRRFCNGIKKKPHPEEAAQRLSRRTHGAGPGPTETFARSHTVAGQTPSTKYASASPGQGGIVTASAASGSAPSQRS